MVAHPGRRPDAPVESRAGRVVGLLGETLPRYAEAQRAGWRTQTPLSARGVPDRGPAQLPVEYRRLLAELAARPTEEGGLTAEEASALENRLPAFDHRCCRAGRLADGGYLQHDDLHSNNVCWPGSRRPVLGTDHRLGRRVCGTPLRDDAGHLELDRLPRGAAERRRPDRRPDALRIRDAYLEPFTDLGSRDELLRWVALARSTGCVTSCDRLGERTPRGADGRGRGSGFPDASGWRHGFWSSHASSRWAVPGCA